jgi:hypothetical protein
MIADSFKQQIPPLRYAPVGMTQYVDDGGDRIERQRQKQIPFGDDNQKGKKRSSWGWRRERQKLRQGSSRRLGELLLFEGEGEFFPFGEEGGALGAELF